MHGLPRNVDSSWSGEKKTYSRETPTNSLPSHAITFKIDPNYPLT